MGNYSSSVPFVWSLIISTCWIAGEIGHKFLRLPRISIYSLFAFSLTLVLPDRLFLNDELSTLLANIGMGLILFEFGYHINLRWLKRNPWLAVSGVLEAVLTFFIIYSLAIWHGSDHLVAWMLASLCMASSPVGILRVINEQRSAGQVTERLLHLTAINCVLSLLMFKFALGMSASQISANYISSADMLMLAASVVLGIISGALLPTLLRWLRAESTMIFSLAVIVLVAATLYLHMSPILATLSFGLATRHSRFALSQTQRNFGVLGNILTIILFVHVMSATPWANFLQGAELGLLMTLARSLIKTGVITGLAPISGISRKKGMLTGLGLAPVSLLGILLFEQQMKSPIAEVLSAFLAMMLILEILGPVVTQHVLQRAGEVRR